MGTKNNNPIDRKVPVNISMELKVMDAVDDEAYKLGKNRSQVIVDILKEYLHIK
jgi:metal-responsive CopG/Arc/MetJ family transcriptional regulator